MDSFHNLKKLRKLYLSDNRLATLDSHVFDAMFRLERIQLDRNQFHCDCNLAPAAKFLSSLKEVPRNLRCQNPQRFRGHVIYQVMARLNCANSDKKVESPSLRAVKPVPLTNVKIPKSEFVESAEVPEFDENTSTFQHPLTQLPTTTTAKTTKPTTEARTTTTSATIPPTITSAESLLPHFLASPEDTEAPVNTTLRLPCQTRNPETFLGWKKNDKRLQSGGRIHITNKELIIERAKLRRVSILFIFNRFSDTTFSITDHSRSSNKTPSQLMLFHIILDPNHTSFRLVPVVE